MGIQILFRLKGMGIISSI